MLRLKTIKDKIKDKDIFRIIIHLTANRSEFQWRLRLYRPQQITSVPLPLYQVTRNPFHSCKHLQKHF